MTEHPCPHCGAPLPEGASFCPHCAKEVEERKPARKAIPLRRKILLALLVLVVVAAGLMGWRLADQPEVYDGQGGVTYGDYQLVLSYPGARATPQPERYQRSSTGSRRCSLSMMQPPARTLQRPSPRRWKASRPRCWSTPAI